MKQMPIISRYLRGLSQVFAAGLFSPQRAVASDVLVRPSADAFEKDRIALASDWDKIGFDFYNVLGRELNSNKGMTDVQ